MKPYDKLNIDIRSLAELFDHATTRFADRLMCYTLDRSVTYTYSQFRSTCFMLSDRLSEWGIGAGNKVVILSENMPNWTVAFFSLVNFGRVAVPILPEMSAAEIGAIILHSDSKAVFVSPTLMNKIPEECRQKVQLIDITTFCLMGEEIKAEPASTITPQPDDLAVIAYTSGTSGRPKGVMLSHLNLSHNVLSANHVMYTDFRYTWLSILPMAHTYELSCGTLYPMYVGAHVCYLMRKPAPSVLMKALRQERPELICAVPLIIEKIYYKQILPSIRNSRILSLMQSRMPKLLYRLIGWKLMKTFGGRVQFFGIGGAKLNPEVEKFLIDAHFPYSIGYGTTEAAPLICNAVVGKTKLESIGVPTYEMQVKLINCDPTTGEGELVAKGPNIMLGYYKDPELTRVAFTEDGWLRTRDIAAVDDEGMYYIKGRLDNVIIGPSGENIYPERIEALINNLDQVEDSVVVNENGRLIAFVKLNDSILDWTKEKETDFLERVNALSADMQRHVNSLLNRSAQIAQIRLMKTPFEKTATHKIKRFLYQPK